MNPRNFLAELKRRNVYRAAVAYAVVAWLLVQAASIVLPTFEAPAWTMKVLIAVLALGLPAAIVFAWAFEITPEGVQRTGDAAPTRSISRQTARKITALIVLLAVIASGLLVYSHFHRTVAAQATLPAFAIDEKSIAVLPFENLSDEKENAFFADGIQDDLLTSLAKIADLKVISRTSVMQYRGAGGNRNLREIAQALGVANVLEGSVRRVANRVLVNVQLIEARRDRHIWAERYDRTIADSIGLQGELATEIANALKATLAPEEKARLASRPTTNPEAYVLYLQARERGRLASSMVDAFATDELYGKAIALDPSFALAFARQSIWNGVMYQQGRAPERKAKANVLAREALRLAPDSGEAHLALGLYFYRAEKDYAAALKEFSVAGTISPNDPEILDYSGLIYRRQGRWRDALLAFGRAQDLDPRAAHTFAPETHRLLRDWIAAASSFKRLLKLEPDLVDVWTGLAWSEVLQSGDLSVANNTLRAIPERTKNTPPMIRFRWEFAMLTRDFATAEQILPDFPVEEFPVNEPKTFYAGCAAFARGDVETARTLFEQLRPIHEAGVRDHPEEAPFHAALGMLYAYLGRKDEAIQESQRAIELCPEEKDAIEGPGYSSNLALVYAVTGEAEQAITLIDRLLITPAAEGISLAELRLNWIWDPLRKDPRFQKILAGPEPKTTYN